MKEFEGIIRCISTEVKTSFDSFCEFFNSLPNELQIYSVVMFVVFVMMFAGIFASTHGGRKLNGFGMTMLSILSIVVSLPLLFGRRDDDEDKKK